MSALDGIRILDLSRVLAGPWATQLLADLGAEVIKVERPGRGDDTRSWGPPFLGDAEQGTRESAYFLSANRGKKSVCIDFSQPEGQKLVRELAMSADVVVENFTLGALGRYGLDYDSLSALNSALVYCSITGFGQTGPYAERPGYDFIIQGMGGLMSITGPVEGPSYKVGVALTDIVTGLYACNAILAALLARARTHRGQHIDISLLDSQVAVLANQAMNYLASGRNPQRRGNAHPNIVPYESFTVADGEITVAVGNDEQFMRLCRALGCEALAADARFLTNAARVAHREILIPILQGYFLSASAQHWLTALEAAQVPCGPINTLDQVFADPQVRHRQMRRDLAHHTLGTVPSVASPFRLSDTPLQYQSGPPCLGEHTLEVLGGHLGMAGAEIERLRESGIVGIGGAR